MERLLLLFLALSLLVLTISGCTGKPPAVDAVSPPVKPANADRATPGDKAAVVRDSNQFTLDLFGRLDKTDNLFFSPASISTALAMTYAGARGQTAEQMAKVLHFQLDAKRLHPAFAALLWEMQGEGKQRGCQLNIANALWGHKGTHFLPDFLQQTKDNYSAGLQQVDFANTDDARRAINAWIAQQTADKIKDLLQPDDVSPQTRLVLTNAIYFKGDWLHVFKGHATHDQPFHITPTKDVSVSMMHQTGEFRHFADEAKSFQLLEMPYKDSELSMVVLLPAQVDGLAQLEKKLDAESLTKGLQQMRSTKVVVTLPKFKMNRRLELADRLQAMGMTAAFHAEEADFSGMTEEKPPLFLNAVIHEAWVDVNEKGTEAAAATAVVAVGAAKPREQPIIFQADHPFLFLIRDTRSGSILFLGRMSNPKD
ncbi:MAG TPA: serpin family protein [Gemmataceae bacterium]|nr:serpin family protein [Gemmataceae bacterium]